MHVRGNWLEEHFSFQGTYKFETADVKLAVSTVDKGFLSQAWDGVHLRWLKYIGTYFFVRCYLVSMDTLGNHTGDLWSFDYCWFSCIWRWFSTRTIIPEILPCLEFPSFHVLVNTFVGSFIVCGQFLFFWYKLTEFSNTSSWVSLYGNSQSVLRTLY